MSSIKIYCDGACSGNPGNGGWGAVLIWKNEIKKISGFEIETTNNRMELTAALSALKIIKRDEVVEVFTDSKYLCDGITEWIKNWKKNGWKTGRNSVKNIDIWQELDNVASQFNIKWNWVKGHSGDYNNCYKHHLIFTSK